MPDREQLRQALLLTAFAGGAPTPDAVMQYVLPEVELVCAGMPLAFWNRRSKV